MAMDTSTLPAQLQRVVNVCTLEASEYERAQRLGLLQPALDALTQITAPQQPGGLTSATPHRANVLLRPLAASTAEQAPQDAVQATPAVTEAADAAKAAVQPTPATAAMLPTPLLMTPAGATLLQTPASNAAWAALRPADAAATLGLSPAVALVGAGVRPVAAFPHFLQGMMAGTPLLQQTRPMRPGEAAQAAEDDSKLSKKRQGYHIEPAALQKLIEKQQLEAQRRHEQEMQAAVANSAHVSQAAAEAEAAAAAAAAEAAAAAAAGDSGNADDPPPRQQQQQHRPRVLSRLPPQVREQAERQAAERARKAAEQQEQEEADAAAAAAADGGAGSSRQHSAVGGAFTQQPRQQPMTAADCLESPNGSLGGLRLPVGPELDPQGQGLDMDLESGKLFGSAQKRLRLSLCDEHGSLMPGGHPLISPVVLPTPSPAIAATPAPALAGGAAAPAAADGSSAAAARAAVATSQDAPTPSKFFSGSPVPQTERRPLGHRAPETPVALVTGAPPPRKADVQEALLDPLRGGAQGADGTAGQVEGGSGSSWVPVPGQAPAVLGATPVPTAPPAAAAGGDGDDMVLDAAAVAAMPLPESPVKQVTAVGAQQQGVGGGGEGGLVLQTPEGQEQAVAATPVTGL